MKIFPFHITSNIATSATGDSLACGTGPCHPAGAGGFLGDGMPDRAKWRHGYGPTTDRPNAGSLLWGPHLRKMGKKRGPP